MMRDNYVYGCPPADPNTLQPQFQPQPQQFADRYNHVANLGREESTVHSNTWTSVLRQQQYQHQSATNDSPAPSPVQMAIFFGFDRDTEPHLHNDQHSLPILPPLIEDGESTFARALPPSVKNEDPTFSTHMGMAPQQRYGVGWNNNNQQQPSDVQIDPVDTAIKNFTTANNFNIDLTDASKNNNNNIRGFSKSKPKQHKFITVKKKISSKACISCRKAHACCGEERPCKRCTMYHLECVDAQSQKRGPKRVEHDIYDQTTDTGSNTIKTKTTKSATITDTNSAPNPREASPPPLTQLSLVMVSPFQAPTQQSSPSPPPTILLDNLASNQGPWTPQWPQQQELNERAHGFQNNNNNNNSDHYNSIYDHHYNSTITTTDFRIGKLVEITEHDDSSSSSGNGPQFVEGHMSPNTYARITNEATTRETPMPLVPLDLYRDKQQHQDEGGDDGDANEDETVDAEIELCNDRRIKEDARLHRFIEQNLSRINIQNLYSSFKISRAKVAICMCIQPPYLISMNNFLKKKWGRTPLTLHDLLHQSQVETSKQLVRSMYTRKEELHRGRFLAIDAVGDIFEFSYETNIVRDNKTGGVLYTLTYIYFH